MLGLSYPIILILLIVGVWFLLLAHIRFRQKRKITEKITKENFQKSIKACFGFTSGILSIYYALTKQFIFGMNEDWLRLVVGLVGIWILIESFYIIFGEEKPE